MLRSSRETIWVCGLSWRLDDKRRLITKRTDILILLIIITTAATLKEWQRAVPPQAPVVRSWGTGWRVGAWAALWPEDGSLASAPGTGAWGRAGAGRGCRVWGVGSEMMQSATAEQVRQWVCLLEHGTNLFVSLSAMMEKPTESLFLHSQHSGKFLRCIIQKAQW